MKKLYACLFSLLCMGMSAANAESIHIDVYSDVELSDLVGSGYDTEITKGADGSFTVANFLDSGEPVSFKFKGVGTQSMCPMEFTSPTLLVSDGLYVYLLNEDGNYITGKVTDDGGNVTTLYFPYIYNEENFTNAYTTEGNDGASMSYDVCVALTGFDENSDATDYYYLNFYFTDNEYASVSKIENDNDAPVEFYNLQGVRVQNPENGIFIRKQGSKVSKMIAR